jgi:hypothetical protein
MAQPSVHITRARFGAAHALQAHMTQSAKPSPIKTPPRAGYLHVRLGAPPVGLLRVPELLRRHPEHRRGRRRQPDPTERRRPSSPASAAARPPRCLNAASPEGVGRGGLRGREKVLVRVPRRLHEHGVHNRAAPALAARHPAPLEGARPAVARRPDAVVEDAQPARARRRLGAVVIPIAHMGARRRGGVENEGASMGASKPSSCLASTTVAIIRGTLPAVAAPALVVALRYNREA